MTPTRFKTNKALWAFISAALFIAPLFMVLNYKSDDNTVWKMVAAGISAGRVLDALEVIAGFALLVGPPALAIGWLIHWLVLTFVHVKRNHTQTSA